MSALKCQYCQQYDDSDKGLKIHITKLHSKNVRVPCKKCSKTFASGQCLSRHMQKHKKEEQLLRSKYEEDLIKRQKETQLVISDTNHQELKEKISGLEEMIRQLQKSLVTQTPSTININQTNNITYVNINSTSVRDMTTKSMFNSNIFIYEQDCLWRSILYTHYNTSFPEMQNIAFYQQGDKYIGIRYDIGNNPVKMDGKELIEEIMRLRKKDLEHWLKIFYPDYSTKTCQTTEEDITINLIRTKLFKDLPVPSYWDKEVKRILREASFETKRVKLLTEE